MKSSSQEKVQGQGGKPRGFIGFIIGRLMNVFHAKIYKLGLSTISIDKSFICLDIGCGGGELVKHLASQSIGGKVYGIDHSDQMVKLSQKVNKTSILNGSVEILKSSVLSLPFADSRFDLITAFETIQFWSDIDISLGEVRRVLKPTGIFLLVNRLPQEHSRWHDFAQIKDADHYKQKLETAGFSDIFFDVVLKRGWIIVRAL